MKRGKKNDLWYNARNKEICGLTLEGRLAADRYAGPCPDPRAGFRFWGARPGDRPEMS